MNDRQNELMRILLMDDNIFLVHQLAEILHCSEKTVRNDLKIIGDYLEKYSSAELYRKPGYGISLNASALERERLLNIFNLSIEKTSEQQTLEIAYQLLLADRPLTLQSLAEQYYTTRSIIKNDIEVIETWLKPFDISVISKQKIGVYIDGDEAKKRSALAHLLQINTIQDSENKSITYLFPEYEVNIVRAVLKKFASGYTDETFDRLIVHVLIMIRRIKQNSPIQIPRESNMDIYDQEEYRLAKRILNEIEPLFALRVPQDEAIYLAWHLMSGKKRMLGKNNSILKHRILDDLVNELIIQMTDITKINFKNDPALLEGLLVHLESVLNRLSYDLPITNPLLSDIKKMYPYTFGMVILVLEKVRKSFSLLIPEEEAAYIVLHFQASLERRQRMKLEKKKAIIVCHMGIGMSQLLRSRIEQQTPDLQIKHCIGRADLKKHLSADEYDLIISTVPLPEVATPHIVVSPLFDVSDQERLNTFIQESEMDDRKRAEDSILLHFIDEGSIFLQVDKEHRYEVVEMLANSLYRNGFVKQDYAHSALLRERMSSTSIGAGIAIPHGNPSSIIRSGIAVAVLKNPLEWGSEKVSIVFLLAVVHEEQKLIKKLFNKISFISENPSLVKILSEQTAKNDFLKHLS